MCRAAVPASEVAVLNKCLVGRAGVPRVVMCLAGVLASEALDMCVAGVLVFEVAGNNCGRRVGAAARD